MQEQEPGLTAPNGGSSAQDAPQDPVADLVPSPEEMLKKAELQAQQHYDAWLRAKAEADNVRKRAQADVASAHKYAVESLAGELLPVRDSLEAALAVDNSTFEALRQGVELTLKQLDTALDKSNIKEINPVGEKFDPHKHQAMTTVQSDKPPNTVVPW
jgi:molecular chaperone GrpE